MRWLPRDVVPDAPANGQESVWDYPRPPALDPTPEHVVVTFAGQVVCDTSAAVRVLETSHPPGYYLPPGDWATGVLVPSTGSSVCEFKGVASYWDVVVGRQVAPHAAWSYEEPTGPFAALRGYVCVYPAAMDQVTVDGEVVRAQAGGFYGGWITDRVVGPFKGGPGSSGW